MFNFGLSEVAAILGVLILIVGGLLLLRILFLWRPSGSPRKSFSTYRDTTHPTTESRPSGDGGDTK